MTALVRFELAFARLADAFGEPELLPARLATACTEVLPIAGAGISLFMPDGFRVPVGASDETAAHAERLQFTLGTGPCIEAHRTRRMIGLTADEMTARWPDFASALTTATPYRAVLAAPLSVGLDTLGTTDLFLDDPAQLARLDPDDVAAVTDAVSHRLSAVPAPATDQGDTDRSAEAEPVWLQSPPAVHRTMVFVAMGMASVDLDVTAQVALRLLRTRALRDRSSVDDIAAAVVARRLQPVDLRVS
ncbi:GAF domain-containing protein [Nakamurella deserti]|uniref:GAF domain-containing protein n=1 Tax=Nakamurella deserti TaxID=2164074 RepID=UPI000DBE0BE6|nr:GAF domain-containing protein [Nakamurella deserti]